MTSIKKIILFTFGLITILFFSDIIQAKSNVSIFIKTKEGVRTGWVVSDGKEYFYNEDGELYKNQFISFGPDVMYYMGVDGSKQVCKIQMLYSLFPNQTIQPVPYLPYPNK